MGSQTPSLSSPGAEACLAALEAEVVGLKTELARLRKALGETG